MIHNIFSKEVLKETKKAKETIEVDFREKNSLVPSELINQNFSVEFKELKVADYIVKGVAIERKEVKDFFSSIFDRRIFSQMTELMQYEKKLLVIEGRFEKVPMHENALKGIFLSITLNYKIPIIFSKSPKETAEYIRLIANKEKNNSSINPKKKNLSLDEELEFIVESFPGIGAVKAKKLLEKFETIKKIINTSEKELSEILGKSSKEFLKLVKRKYQFVQKKKE